MRYLTEFFAFLEADKEQNVREMVNISTNREKNINFIDLNEEKFKPFKNAILEDENLLRILKTPESEWPHLTEIFNNLDILSGKLEKSGLNVRDKFKIIIRLYEKNIAAHILETAKCCISETQMLKYNFEHFPSEYIVNQMRTPRFYEIQTKPEEELSEEDKLLLDDIQKFTSFSSQDMSDIQHQNKIIYEHYIAKKDSYTKEDIDIVMKTLLNSGLSQKLYEEISAYLNYSLQKRLNKSDQENYNIVNFPSKPKVESKEPTLTKKEYYNLEKELNTYFDFTNMQPIMVLSEDEITRCLNILCTLNENPSRIEQFIIKEARYTKQNAKNSFALYLAIYNKLKFYAEKLNITSELEDLKMYLQEMIIPSSDKDYREWKDLFEEDLNAVHSQVSSLTAYEKSLSMKLK